MLKICINILLALLFGVLQGCEGEKAEAVKDEPAQVREFEGTIVALGDSLTAGLGVNIDESYPALLQQRLVGDGHAFRVVNAGVSGETSSGTLSRLDWILGQEPDIVVLEIGANDGLRGIDTDLVESNLRRILQRLEERDIVVVLAGMKMVWNLGEQYTGRFNLIYQKLADEFDVIFMPFFLESVAAVPKLNQSDGIHPNKQGYRVVTENIYPYVLQAVRKYKNLAK